MKIVFCLKKESVYCVEDSKWTTRLLSKNNCLEKYSVWHCHFLIKSTWLKSIESWLSLFLFLWNKGSWHLPILCCNLYIFFDVLLCTTSIWHLTILSIDRFLHISRPFRSRERSKRKTFLTIVCIWTFSIGISCTILILGFTDEKNIISTQNPQKRYCFLNNQSFMIYGSIICFCIPCTLMLVTYSLTIRRLRLEAAKCYTDPDDHLVVKSQSSERLRRHHSTSKRRVPSSKNPSTSSSKELRVSSEHLPTNKTIEDEQRNSSTNDWA